MALLARRRGQPWASPSSPDHPNDLSLPRPPRAAFFMPKGEVVKKSALTAERLRELLDYDPDTGEFTWKVRRGKGRIVPGKKAGSVFKNPNRTSSYARVAIDGCSHYAHRLAWLWMTGEWPKEHIDHVDRNGLNNRWGNIRTASPAQNNANSSPRSHSASGLKGVHYCKKSGRFHARISVKRRTISLGSFGAAEDAASAYVAAALEHYGAFATAE